eukprot:Rmarinus@m.13439
MKSDFLECVQWLQNSQPRLVLDYVLLKPSISLAYDENGHTLLHWASLFGNVDLCQRLVSVGSKIDAPTVCTGQTPLMWGCIKGSLQAIRFLIMKGADVGYRDCKGFTPLLLAVQESHTLTVLFLLRNGASLYESTDTGLSAAHLAARSGNVSLLLLIQRFELSCEPRCFEGRGLMSSCDGQGCTPLHHAAMGGHLDACVFLMTRAGAKACLSVQNNDGLTPLDLTVQYNRLFTRRFLESYALSNNCLSSRQGKKVYHPNSFVADVGASSPVEDSTRDSLDGGDDGKFVVVRKLPSSDSHVNSYSWDYELDKGKVSWRSLLLRPRTLCLYISLLVRNAFFRVRTFWSTVKDLCGGKYQCLKLAGKLFRFLLPGQTATRIQKLALTIGPWAIPFVFFLLYVWTVLAFLFEITPWLSVDSYVLRVGMCLVFFVPLSYLNCMLRDPGFIRDEGSLDKYINDVIDEHVTEDETEVSHVFSMICSSCGILRPSRSKHCDVCGHCVMRMDHHCVWIRNCVGAYNRRSFVVFLFLLVTSQALFVFFGATVFIRRQVAPLFLLATVALHIFLIFPVVALLFVQLKNASVNLTTNEKVNVYRYDTFWKKENGVRVFRNPYDRGSRAHNLVHFLCDDDTTQLASRSDADNRGDSASLLSSDVV